MSYLNVSDNIGGARLLCGTLRLQVRHNAGVSFFPDLAVEEVLLFRF